MKPHRMHILVRCLDVLTARVGLTLAHPKVIGPAAGVASVQTIELDFLGREKRGASITDGVDVAAFSDRRSVSLDIVRGSYSVRHHGILYDVNSAGAPSAAQ